MKYVVIILSLVVVGLIFFRPEKNEIKILRQQLYQEKLKRERIQQQADSIQREVDLLVIHYKNLSAAYRKATEEEIKWQRKYELEKKRKVGILTDAGYDSLLNSLYPR